MQCIWFSFSYLIQFELNNFAKRWNMHHIRSSNANCIAGVLDQLFTSPEEYGYINCGRCHSFGKLGHLKQQIDIERAARRINYI